jgi:hypothetical protein
MYFFPELSRDEKPGAGAGDGDDEHSVKKKLAGGAFIFD